MKMPEKNFYERAEHETVLNKITEYEDFIKEMEAGTLNDAEQADLEGIKAELQSYKNKHAELMNRAHTEALQLNSLYDYQKERAAARAIEEATYQEAKSQLTQLFASYPNLLESGHGLDQTHPSSITGIAEESITIRRAGDKILIDLALIYPEFVKSEPLTAVERSCTLEINAATGDITNWNEAPMLLRLVPDGRTKILQHLFETFESMREKSIPTYTINEALVLSDEGEPQATPAGPDMEALRSFYAYERYEILESYEPLFTVNSVDGSPYNAFVYDDYIIFDSLRYGNAIFFIPLKDTVSDEIKQRLDSIHRHESDGAMEEILKFSGFYAEIKRTRTERKELGHRYSKPHLSRPQEGDKNTDYVEKLKDYYREMFDYVKKQTQAGRVQIAQPNPNLEIE